MSQSTEVVVDSPLGPRQVGRLFSLSDLTTLLIKENGLHEGYFETAITFNLGIGAFANGPGLPPLPGAFFGVESFALRSVQPEHANNPNVVDAAVVNPPKRPRTKKVSVTK